MVQLILADFDFSGDTGAGGASIVMVQQSMGRRAGSGQGNRDGSDAGTIGDAQLTCSWAGCCRGKANICNAAAICSQGRGCSAIVCFGKVATRGEAENSYVVLSHIGQRQLLWSTGCSNRLWSEAEGGGRNGKPGRGNAYRDSYLQGLSRQCVRYRDGGTAGSNSGYSSQCVGSGNGSVRRSIREKS